MALPLLALINAGITLIPLLSKKGPSEKEAAKAVLKDNNGTISSSLGLSLMASGLAVATLEEAVYGLVMGIVGLICYIYRKV